MLRPIPLWVVLVIKTRSLQYKLTWILWYLQWIFIPLIVDQVCSIGAVMSPFMTSFCIFRLLLCACFMHVSLTLSSVEKECLNNSVIWILYNKPSCLSYLCVFCDIRCIYDGIQFQQICLNVHKQYHLMHTSVLLSFFDLLCIYARVIFNKN